MENEKDSKSEIVELLNKLGAIYMNKLKEFDLAIEKFEDALKINLNLHGKFHSSVAKCLCNLGLSWKGKFNYEKAIVFLNESIEITLTNNEKTNKNLTLEYKNIAFCFCEIKEYDRSIEFYEKALKIDLEINGKNHLITGTTFKNLASVWNKKKNYHNAIEYYEKYLNIKLTTLGAANPEVASLYFEIGNMNKRLNKFVFAIENYQKGFIIDKKGGFPFKIAQCYEALNQPIEALDYYIQSAEIRKNHPKVGLDDEATQESISNAKRLAKELDKENELPEWMR